MINTYNEGALHEALKLRYALDGSQIEQKVGRYVVDVVREDRLIEIQTRGFSALKQKIPVLLREHSVMLVHPIPLKKILVKRHSDGRETRRTSPKRGNLFDVFNELVSIPELLTEPKFALELVLTHEEEFREFNPRRAWRRRGWVVKGRRLLDIIDTHRIAWMSDLLQLVSKQLPVEFTTSELADAMNSNRALAQKAAYCFRNANVTEVVGKRGNALIYKAK